MTSWHLILAIFSLLLGFGLMMVLSASSITSFRQNGGSSFATFKTQAVFAVIGLCGFLFTSRMSTRVMRTISLPAVAVSVLLLAAVLLIGNKTYGAQSWITIGPINLQPSELAKAALLLWMGHVLAARRNTLRSLRALLIPVLPVFALLVYLIMKQPDLGTTITLAMIFIAVLWFGGAPMWIFAATALLAGAGGVYLATSAGYRNLRVLAWLHPESAPADAVWQINQSMFGLGHGGVFGVGLGESVSKTGWLPNADSDFIFAIIGEELGLIGAGLVVVLFGLLAYTGLRIARRNVDPFIKIVAAAATVWLVGQAVINIGYVVGLLPVTGLTLPMISRGGTSLVVTMAVFGLLANFARREPQAAAALRSQGPGRVARFLGLDSRPPKPSKARSAPKPPKAPKAPRAPKAPTARPAVPARRPGAGSGRPVPAERSERPRGQRQAATAVVPASASSGRRPGPGTGRRPAADQRTAPVLRRSGDGSGKPLPAADRQGHAFVEPQRPRRPQSPRRGAGADRRPTAAASERPAAIRYRDPRDRP